MEIKANQGRGQGQVLGLGLGSVSALRAGRIGLRRGEGSRPPLKGKIPFSFPPLIP